MNPDIRSGDRHSTLFTRTREAFLLHDAAMRYADECDGEPGLVCGYCLTLWTPLALLRFGDQACPTCGDLYPGVNREP